MRAQDIWPKEGGAQRKSRQRSKVRRVDRRNDAGRRAGRKAIALFRLHYSDAVLQTVRALGNHTLSFREPAENLSGRLGSPANRDLTLARNVTGGNNEHF